jgi:thiamine-monophosphate kinase
VLGIGDDAAAWRPSRSHLSVITTDALLDGSHFLTDRMDPQSIGYRAMAANLSDLAAMGARPVLATVALGVPEGNFPSAPFEREPWLLELYRGMAGLAARFGVRIAGGDIVRAPALSLALTLVGEVALSRLKRRSGGRPGDVVAVTGPLGASRAGLSLLFEFRALAAKANAEAFQAFAKPVPRIAEGRWLGASVHVHAMMDCSDGLSTDLSRLAGASECGAQVERVPVASAAEAVAPVFGADARDFALHGGEDFELLVAVSPRAFPHLAKRFEQRFGRPLLFVGHLEEQPGLRFEDRELIPAGWDSLA